MKVSFVFYLIQTERIMPHQKQVFTPLLYLPLIIEQVSQNWFSGVQRVLATTILAMSSPVGVMLASSITPLLVKDAEDIPTQNWVYSIPSTLTMLMFILFIRTSVPPTPPSQSAEQNVSSQSYFQRYEQHWSLEIM